MQDGCFRGAATLIESGLALEWLGPASVTITPRSGGVFSVSDAVWEVPEAFCAAPNAVLVTVWAPGIGSISAKCPLTSPRTITCEPGHTITVVFARRVRLRRKDSQACMPASAAM